MMIPFWLVFGIVFLSMSGCLCVTLTRKESGSLIISVILTIIMFCIGMSGFYKASLLSDEYYETNGHSYGDLD